MPFRKEIVGAEEIRRPNFSKTDREGKQWKTFFKTLEILNKAKRGILYSNQGKNQSYDNEENSCSRHQKKS